MNVQSLLPGFFLLGRNYIAAARPDGSLVGPAGMLDGVQSTPARPGEVVSLYGTGFGPTSPFINSGEAFQGAASLTSGVEVRVGTTYAEVQFAGLSAAGLYQINIVVPNVPDGDHDVRATVAGVSTQPLARLRVTR